MKLYGRWTELARSLDRTDDPVLRQEILELYSILQVNRWNCSGPAQEPAHRR